jgi:hypothetical protein
MSNIDEVEKSLNNSIAQSIQYLQKIKLLIDSVPAVEQRIKEDEAKLAFYQNMPSTSSKKFC